MMPNGAEYQLILERLTMPAQAQVLVLYARSAPALLRLHDFSAGGRVVAIAPELPDYTRLQKEIGTRAGAEITVVLEELHTAPGGGPFDCAILDTDGPAGRGNPYTFRLIDYMVRHVKPGGSIWLQGSNSRGGQSFVRHLSTLGRDVTAMGVGGGKRAYRALRPSEEMAETAAAEEQTVISMETQGIRFQLTVQPGVFSGHKVDEATALLIEAMRLHRGDDVLDLGCGAGAIGIAAALLAPEGQTLLVDSSPLAVRLAERNIADNGITNASVLLSDGYSAVQGRRFDVIATNPPFHQHSKETRAVAERFVREAPDCLRPGGRLLVVANAFLAYQRTMERVFDDVRVVTGNARYRVLAGRVGPAELHADL